MLSNLKPYPAMKESGVPWLGEVPAHWHVRRLKTVVEMRVSNVDKHSEADEEPVRLCNYVDVYKNARILSSMTFMRSTATRDEITRFRIQAGDVLITKDSETWTDIGVPALVVDSPPDLVCGYHLALLRPLSGRIVSGYLFRALQSKGVAYQFHVEATGVTRYGLSHSSIKSIWFPIPPVSEQVLVVRFLDHFDQRIRRYIRAKQKLLKLLEEQKQAIIHRAFTRGIDFNRRLKPSGVQGLEDVPEHWQIRRIKQCSTVISKGTTPSTEGRETFDFGPVRFLKAENIVGGRISDNPLCFIDNETHYALRRSQLKEDDILFVIAGATLGKTAVVERPYLPANTNQAVAFIRTNSLVVPEYLAFWLQSPRIRELTWLMAVQSAQPNLSMANLGNFVIPLPALDEQYTIVALLKSSLAKLINAISRAQEEISLLREYRTHLVADAVTGKLDLRDAATRLREKVEAPCGFDDTEPENDSEGSTEIFDAALEEMRA